MSGVKGANALTPKQEAFVQAYLETGNATEAYRRAYNAGGMKAEAIHVNASKLLSSTKVALRLADLQRQAAERNGITVDWIVQKFKRFATADIREALSWDANGDITLTPSASLPAGFADAISEVSKGKNGFRFKLHDKQAALVNLGRHLGMFKDVQEMTGKGGGPIETRELSDMEAARRIAYMLGRAVGRANAVQAPTQEVESK